MLRLSLTAFESKSDVLIFFISLAISVILFSLKLFFLVEIHAGGISLLSLLSLFFVNLAPYLCICAWVYVLLSHGSNWYLKTYVLFSGVIFTLLVRMIESLEEVTRQGAGFEILNHLVLALAGHAGWEEVFFKWAMRLGLFILLALGFLIKFFGNSKKINALPLWIFITSLCVAFLPVYGYSVPKSLSQNGLIYTVKQAWIPVKEIPAVHSDFQFKQVHTESVTISGDLFASLKGKHVALIILESTSANMLSFYRNNDSLGNTTPFMAALAENALLVNETSSTMNSTSKSLVNILCGIEPYLQTQVFEVTLGIPVKCLPKRLANMGYHTSFFQTATYYYEGRDRLVEHAGFEEFISVDMLPTEDVENAQMIGPLGREDKALLNTHQRWINKRVQSQQPFLAVYLTLAQHHPYMYPESVEHYVQYSEDAYLNGFTNSLVYIDEYLSEISEQYKQAGIYDDTLFVIVGDHGESFGRYHLPKFHNNVLYREGLWVPFILVNKHIFKGKQELLGEFGLFDVAPTIEYLLGVELSSEYRGLPVFHVPEERMLHAACWYNRRCLASFDKHYKYIFNYGDMPEELYDRQNDFREQNNIASQHPELVERYRRETFTWYNDIRFGYHQFYSGMNEDYLNQAESYYRFPSEFIPNKEDMQKW